MSWKVQLAGDYSDPSLPRGFMRNAVGQEVRVEYCCQLSAQDIDCGHE